MNREPTQRLFIALDLGPDQKRAITRVADSLAPHTHAVRWSKFENMHLTLKFLGQVPDERITKIEDALREVASQQAPFTITLDELGAFPSRKKPVVIWVGTNQAKDCADLSARIDHTLKPEGFDVEARPFFAHVTIGRLKRGARFEWPDAWQHSVQALPACRAERLLLYRSELTPTNANHHLISGQDFGG